MQTNLFAEKRNKLAPQLIRKEVPGAKMKKPVMQQLTTRGASLGAYQPIGISSAQQAPILSTDRS